MFVPLYVGISQPESQMGQRSNTEFEKCSLIQLHALRSWNDFDIVGRYALFKSEISSYRTHLATVSHRRHAGSPCRYCGTIARVKVNCRHAKLYQEPNSRGCGLLRLV